MSSSVVIRLVLSLVSLESRTVRDTEKALTKMIICCILEWMNKHKQT